MASLVLRLVICLLAAVPQGVCTCAAASCPDSTSSAPLTTERPHAEGRCRHNRPPAAPTHDEGQGDGIRGDSPAAPADGHQDHDPDCRAVLGGLTGAGTKSAAAEQSQAEVSFALPAAQAGAGPVRLTARTHLTPLPKLPLFLTLGVLRN